VYRDDVLQVIYPHNSDKHSTTCIGGTMYITNTTDTFHYTALIAFSMQQALHILKAISTVEVYGFCEVLQQFT